MFQLQKRCFSIRDKKDYDQETKLEEVVQEKRLEPKLRRSARRRNEPTRQESDYCMSNASKS